MFVCLSGTLSGLLLVAVGYISCEHAYLAVAVLSVATGFCGLQFPSVMVNHVDIAPPFAAVLLGISNSAATVPGFVAPYVVKSLTPNVSGTALCRDDEDVVQWLAVWFVVMLGLSLRIRISPEALTA